ncbi:MAG: AEC family transporter [Synergistaceae bacterium]|nr:AEC family transporter [Synergistaceae bacterium]
MQLDFFVVMSNLASLFALIAVGYAAVKLGIVSTESQHHFSILLMKITLPCTIFISLAQREYNPAFIHDSVIIIIAGLVGFPFMLYLSRWVLAGMFRVPQGRRGIWSFLCAFNNSGFMGFPIALSLFGAEGLALSVMMNISFNMTIYTLGAIEIARDNPGHDSEGLNMKSIIFSGINIATVLSLIFYFGRINLPATISAPLSYISGITTPLSMMIIGMTLAHSKVADMFTDIHAWTATIMRLAVYPVLWLLAVKVFPLGSNPLVEAVYVLIMSMPGASVTVGMCEMYHGDIDFAAKIMFIQNILCMVTIPAICVLL